MISESCAKCLYDRQQSRNDNKEYKFRLINFANIDKVQKASDYKNKAKNKVKRYRLNIL